MKGVTFYFDWRWIRSDGPDRRIQARIWIYFHPLCSPTASPPSSPPVSIYPFLGDGPYGLRVACPITPAHHHPKSLPDSLKGHGGGHGLYTFLFFLLYLSYLFRFCICGKASSLIFTYCTLFLCQSRSFAKVNTVSGKSKVNIHI